MTGGGWRSVLIPVLALVVTVGSSNCKEKESGENVPVVESRSFSILAINDVYRIEGISDAGQGGLSRLRTLRESLEAEGREPLLLHGGDFLQPSFLSRSFEGEQMIDVMNLLDGDAAGFDARMLVTFGNHEFDKDDLDDAPMLQSRIDESQFRWLGSNINFLKVDDVPLVDSENLVKMAIVESGGVKVGLFSVTAGLTRPDYVRSFSGKETTARKMSAELREGGAEVVVAVTHQEMKDDLELAATLKEAGPDMIIGGHEHQQQKIEVDGRWIFKADADAITASVIRGHVSRSGELLGVEHEFVRLGPEFPAPDPMVEDRVQDWLTRHDKVFCVDDQGIEAGCLEEPLGLARTTIGGEEVRIRRFETSLGNWVSDKMIESFAEQGAQAAFINSGALRLNRDLPAGTQITRRHIEELCAFPMQTVLVRVTGRTLQKAMERSIENWTASGHFLQVGGLTFVHDPEEQSVSRLALLEADGPRLIDPDERIKIVTIGFLVNPRHGQDGYTMLSPNQVLQTGARSVKQILIDALLASDGIAPVVEGRMCNTLVDAPCLAPGAAGT